jgi:hypothetical protein
MAIGWSSTKGDLAHAVGRGETIGITMAERNIFPLVAIALQLVRPLLPMQKLPIQIMALFHHRSLLSRHREVAAVAVASQGWWKLKLA